MQTHFDPERVEALAALMRDLVAHGPIYETKFHRALDASPLNPTHPERIVAMNKAGVALHQPEGVYARLGTAL